MLRRRTIGALFKYINILLEKNANNELRKDNVTLVQVHLLLTLSFAGDNGYSLKKLEKESHVAQSTMAGIVERSQKKGFVESVDNHEDKRIKVVRITEKGRTVCTNAKRHMDLTEQKLTSKLNENEIEQLKALLEKVISAYE